MAKKKLTYDQIAEKNLLDPLIKELQEVNSLLKLTAEGLKVVAKESAEIAKSTPLESFDNIEKVEKSIRKVTDAVEDLDKVEKDKLKLDQKIKELNDDRTKANFELREEIRLQTKGLRDAAKASKEIGDDFKILTRRTNEAQANFKKLAAEFGVTSDEAKKAQKEFTKLDDELKEINDAARDGRRDVGRYTQAVSKLSTGFKALAGAAIFVKVFELLGNAFNSNSEGAAKLEKVVKSVTVAVSVFVNRLVIAFPIIRARFNLFFLGLEKGFAQITNLFGGNEEEVARLTKAYNELASEAGKDITDIFKGMGDEISNLIDKSDELIDTTAKHRREIIRQQKAIAELIPIQRELEAVAGDQTTSLKEQIAAQQALTAVTDTRLARETKIAKLTFDLAVLNAEVNKFNIESQEELAEATIALAEAEAEQLGIRVENFKEVNQFLSDQLELNLDFYVDDFDNLKTVNERIIADSTETFKRRRELLDLNLELAQVSFDNEQKILNDSLARKGKALIDFDALSASTSAKENARIIEDSGLSEQLGIRALEIIREKRTVVQDNVEAQRDLNAAEKDANDIRTDLILTDAALLELQEKGVDLALTLEGLSAKRLANDIANLRIRLSLARNGSAEFVEINQELNEKLLEQQQTRIMAEQEAERKNLERRKELQETIFGVISEVVSKAFEKRLTEIDDEISAEEKRADRLFELAAEGNEDAENNLAITQKRQAELELERENQLKRQKQSELALAAIETYSAKVTEGEKNPLAATIADISVLRAFVASLPGFFEGSERVGDDLNPLLSGRDGHIIRVDGDERILSPGQSKIIPNSMSNMELALLASNAGKAKYADMKTDTSRALVNEIKNLTRITESRPVYMGLDYDRQKDAIITTVEKKGRLERKHTKNGGIWG